MINASDGLINADYRYVFIRPTPMFASIVAAYSWVMPVVKAAVATVPVFPGYMARINGAPINQFLIG